MRMVRFRTLTLLQASKDVIVNVEDATGLDATDASDGEEDRRLHFDAQDAALGPRLELITQRAIVEAPLRQHHARSMLEAFFLGTRLFQRFHRQTGRHCGISRWHQTIRHSVVSHGTGRDKQATFTILRLEGTTGACTNDQFSSSLRQTHTSPRNIKIVNSPFLSSLSFANSTECHLCDCLMPTPLDTRTYHDEFFEAHGCTTTTNTVAGHRNCKTKLANDQALLHGSNIV